VACSGVTVIVLTQTDRQTDRQTDSTGKCDARPPYSLWTNGVQ